MSNSEPVSSLKGIGEKTGKLFEKLGVITIDDLQELMIPMSRLCL